MRPDIEVFAATARRYCDWARKVQGGPDDVREALRRIVDVYGAALTLPYPPWPDDAEDDAPDFAQERAEVRAGWAGLAIQNYAEQFDPLTVPPSENPTIGNLTDDVTDIFGDLREGLWYFDEKRMDEAAWTWGFLFHKHWGRHAASAIRVLHAHLVENA